ncbi:MAG: glycerol kinase GlpK [Burkholderiales bacterium]|nr:glycerol kinase GlpK [Burkholderiales bacterium]
MKKYILALDQGTTSSRAILFDREGNICSTKQQEFEQIFPAPGLVEHNPNEIWLTQLSTAKLAMSSIGAQASDIAAIGITNQRETTVVWNIENGIPIYNAIVWQDRRTSAFIDELKKQGYADLFKQKTGLVLDAYFSGTKLKWILDNVDGARQLAESGKLAFGTIDTWITWNLTNRREHVTDESNASRTLLFNIHTGQWDDELLKILDIPKNILPKIVPSSGVIGEASSGLFGERILIAGIAGDQQAATFGNLCLKPGMVKNTYGTGCFLLKNTGEQALESKNNLLTTTGWQIDGKRNYCLEGAVFIAGAAVQWVRDGLRFIDDSSEIEALAASVPDNGGVYMVPAFTGLGAPHWDQYARGAIVGITRGTTQSHIARATLESIAFQVTDLVSAMKSDSHIDLKALRVDGGACKNNLLMQFQADLLNCAVERPTCLELTALGAAYLAGLAVGFWQSTDELEKVWKVERIFEPNMTTEHREELLYYWNKAVGRSLDWIK